MSPSLSISANLSPVIRQRLAIEVLAQSKPVSDIADEHQVSGKFVYRLKVNKATVALTECFAPSIPDDRVLFYLPIAKSWLTQLTIGLILICHSCYRGVVSFRHSLFSVMALA